MCVALVAILSGILLTGCSSGSSTQTAAPAAQTQQQTTQPTQQQTTTSGQQPSGQQPSGQGQEGMKKVIAKAATILGVSETDLTTAFDAAMKANRPSGSDNMTSPSGQPPSGQSGQGQPPSGQSGQQGQAPSGSSDMMKSVYAKIATALSLTTEEVQTAFEQAQSELKQ